MPVSRISSSWKLMSFLFVGIVIIGGLALSAHKVRSDAFRERDLARIMHGKLEESVTDLTAQLASAPRYDFEDAFWDHSSSGAAIALIQQTINELALEQDIRLRSVAPSLSENDLGFDQASLRLEFEVYLDDLVWFLGSLERHEPLLLITTLNVRRLARQNPSKTQQQVFVQMVIDAPLQPSNEGEEL